MTTGGLKSCFTAAAATTVFSLPNHDLKIRGYSKSLNSPRQFFNSLPFHAGGYKWHIRYLPRGIHGDSDYISFLLALDDDIVHEAVLAYVTFTLLIDPFDDAVPYYTRTTAEANDFSTHRTFGIKEFIERGVLEEPEHLILEDDCFVVRVQIHLIKETPSIMVPPSDMPRHLGSLLLSMEDADVEFRVGGETFAAHRLVLAARSPVFNAQLYGPMKEGMATHAIQVDDMEAQVFKAMLHFIYTDVWPEMEQEDEPAMAQHLLVAADRYCMQRLKLMCETKLQNHIDAGSVANILALADKHNCTGLKEACFRFLVSLAPYGVMETDEFQYLAQSCPTIADELDALLLGRDLDKAKIS